VRRALVLLLALAALGGAAVPAHADLEIGMEDEGLILSNPHLAPFAAEEWSKLGVDIVRIHTRWWEIAPDTSSQRKPARFNASDPNDPRYSWADLDAAVALIRSKGMRVMLTITGPGPLWSTSSPRKRNPRLAPKSAEYAAFSRATAARYGGQVDRYLLWNEPNQPGWLQPQWECKRRRDCSPVAPHIYRNLVRAATPAIHAADPGSEVVIGELAPIGNSPISNNTPIAPLPFLRAMGCVDERYRTLRRGRCKGFKPARADAFGYHPHPVKNAPDAPNPDINEAQFADLSRLFAVLDRLKARGRLQASGGFHLTEFGYQTSPPDHAIGITLAQQTRYLQQAAFVAWRAKRVKSLSYYQWDDEPVVYRGRGTKAYSGWQSGLRFVTGKPKPVLSTFPAPFVIERRKGSSSARFWGQVRPAAMPAVMLQIRPRDEAEFRDVAPATLAGDGSWTIRGTATPGAAYRFLWTPQPSLTEPLPAPRFSGVVELFRSEKTLIRAAAAVSS
jgi:hypothetical protein